MSRPRISSARAAVSYSIRHSALSRSGTSSRQIAATCARVSARVVSTGTFGRAHPAVGSAVTQPASAHQASAERRGAEHGYVPGGGQGGLGELPAESGEGQAKGQAG